MSENNDKKAAAQEAPLQDETQKTELDIAIEEAAKWKNDFLYLKAEFENYKRNVLKERSDLLKFGSERIARDLLEVVDNFDRALEINVTAETVQNFKVGIELVAKEMKDMLSKHGITEVPSTGEAFNPQHHEAISSEATNTVPEGHVSRVFKKPYKLHDKIIRMGQVVVATAQK